MSKVMRVPDSLYKEVMKIARDYDVGPTAAFRILLKKNKLGINMNWRPL